LPNPASLARRARSHIVQRRHAASFAAGLDVSPRDDLLEVGDLNYGGYILPTSLLSQDSVCYLAGTGEDISFDLSVIARFGCEVHSLDPVPRAARHVAVAAAYEKRLVFHPVALWSTDQDLTFYAPRESGYVSQSATNLYDTAPDFTAAARAVSSLMAELGHDQIDLLKVSAEGSEYEIVDHVIDQQLDVRTLCVEYAQPAPVERVQRSLARLRAAGFVLVAASVRTWNWKLTFVGPKVGDAESRDGSRATEHTSAHGRRRSVHRSGAQPSSGVPR
jgi:FkbM family methyltransferase